MATRVLRPVAAVLALCVAVLVFTTPLHLLFQPAYARYQYASSRFVASVRFNAAERARLSDTILRYMEGRASVEEMATMETDAGTTALTPEETQHLVDVKGVVVGFYIAQAVALVAAVVACVVLWRRYPRGIVLALRVGAGLVLGFLAFIGVAAASDFDRFFTLFHGVFFKAGTWTFLYTDTLIQLYPLPFWTAAVTHLLILMAAGCALMLGLAYALSRRLSRSVSG